MAESHRAPRSSGSLRAPLKGVLDDALSEADIQRMWRELQRGSGEPVRPLRRRVVVLGAACALALCAALGAAAGFARLWRGETPHAAGPLAIVGANATRSGLGPAQAFGGVQPTRLSLDDGSHVDLARAARLEVLENSGRTFVTRLRSGRGEFDVKPGGPRRWSIDCGAVTVEVVGTQFAIDRSEQGVRVHVSRGVVRVRGEHVADRARSVSAGETLYVPAVAPERLPVASEQAAQAAQQQPAITASTAPLAVVPEAPTAVPAAGIAAAAAAGVASANAAPADSAAGSADTAQPAEQARFSAAMAERWLRRADDARRQGQRARAEALFEEVVQRGRGSPHAAVAALSLARLLMADEPARAAAALATVGDLRAPRGLREDIMARLVEAYARAGRLDRAREAADDYARAFPRGRRRDEVRHWASTQ